MPDQTQVKLARNGRLLWFRAEADEAHWYRHWADKVRSDYYSAARELPLGASQLGRTIAETFDPKGRLLEAGCGAGWYVAALDSHGFDVEGIEYSKMLVDLVNRTAPELAVRFGDATHLGESDGSYSSYLSIGVVEHRETGPEPFLQEAFRLLRPGGRAIVTVPGFGPIRRIKARLGGYRAQRSDLPPFYQFGFDVAELASLIEAVGFRIDHTEYHSVHRLLHEEFSTYRYLSAKRGGERFLRRPLERLIGTRDGHMAVVVATRPESGHGRGEQ